MYFYDYETTFLAKGHKRREQQLLEVGIVRGRKAYKALVDPVRGHPIIPRLVELGQDPKRTLHFWTKLLAAKGLLNTAVRRKSLAEQAAAIDRVRGDFATPEEAIRGMVAFGEGTWVAHNGNAFDHPITKAHFERFNMTPKIEFKDSLPELRKMKLQSHSLGYVYKHLFGGVFRQHHALDDAIALQKICRHKKLFLHTPLTTIKGIGPKSEEILRKAGIRCVEDLKLWVLNHKEADFTFHVHHRKALAKRLFKMFKI